METEQDTRWADIPPEILLQILGDLFGLPKSLNSVQRTILARVQRVCRTWKEITDNDPNFWQGVDIDLSEDFKAFDKARAADLVNGWLRRSGRKHRLTLRCSPQTSGRGDDANAVFISLLPLLGSVEGGWEELVFDKLPRHHMAQVQQLSRRTRKPPANWRSVTKLAFQHRATTLESGMVGFAGIPFEDVSSLGSLSLGGVSFLGPARNIHTHKSLTSLHLSYFSADATFTTKLVETFPALEELTLARGIHAHGAKPSPITHSGIERLGVVGNGTILLLPDLSLPSLRLLRLCQMHDDPPLFYNEIRALLARSVNHIEVLSLEDSGLAPVPILLLLRGLVPVHWLFVPSFDIFINMVDVPRKLKGILAADSVLTPKRLESLLCVFTARHSTVQEEDVVSVYTSEASRGLLTEEDLARLDKLNVKVIFRALKDAHGPFSYELSNPWW